jgi:hypothetical protein
MRSVTCAIGVALMVAAVRPGTTAADDAPPAYRAVIDRVDLEPTPIGGLRLRVQLSALALGGQLLDISDRKALRLMVGGSKLEAPYALGTYAATNADTAIVVVIQANLAYADALPGIVSTLDDVVLSALGERTQLAIMPYGESTGAAKLTSLKTARSKLSDVSADGSAGEPALLDTLDRALLLLKKARTTPEGRPLRKLILVISDGHDRSGDRDRVTGLGKRADKAGVRIHTFGYAPSKVLRPLLTLGELSKRSLGTFRWVRSGGAESWGPAFQQLREEINKQYVLTYFLNNDTDVAGKKLKIVTVGRTEATSNELKIPDPGCAGEPCPDGYCASSRCVVPQRSEGRGIIGWAVLVLGIVVGVAVALGVIGYLLQRRQQPAGAQLTASPGQPGFPIQPGVAPQGPVPGGKLGKRDKRGKLANPPPAVVAPAPVTGPALLVMTGPRTGQRIPLHNGFTIGKAPASDLVLDDGYTSTQHAQVGMDQAGNCRLYDRNSTNGTFANGVRVTEVVLDHGMSLRIGSTELRFLAQ